MKMMVAVAIIAVLACALFLVPYASAKVEIDCSVHPEKADFKSDFVYSITLTNSGSFISVGYLKLIVGSDSDITREWEVTDMKLEPGSSGVIEYGKIRIPAGKSCTVKIRVQFTHHKLYQGAFKDWTETENPDLPEWDKAWYEWFFIDTRSEKVSCDGSGEPILKIPCIVKFRELPVEQNEAYKDLSFDYHVKVKANCEDRIELQVRNYSKTSSDGWDKHGLKEYTGLDVYTNKTLTWHAVNLTLDNFREGQGLYKFVGNIRESQPYSGPTIEERFDYPKASYNETIKELFSFDYEVTAWVNWVKSSIRLEVYNYFLHDWEEKGIRNYTTPGKNQKLRWESIILSSDYFKKDTLSGKYRFVGSYNKNKLEIIDPTIEEKFYPLDVAPTQGTNTDTFNYSVTVNANICDKIELQVKNHTIDNKWDSKGTRDYVTPNINKTLTWDNIKLNTHELDQFNDSMFRFYGTKVGINSSTSTGPFYPLDLSWRNPSVRPNEGLYLYDSKFGYCIEVNSTKEIDVKLRVFYPHKGEAVIAGNTKSYTRGDRGNWKLICWNDTQPFVEEDEGDTTYKFEFHYTDTQINETERSGPSIGIAIFKDASLEPEIGTRETEFTFSVWVKAVKSDYVTLKVYDSNRDCVAERKSKDKTTTEWKHFVFENVSFKVPPALGNASHEYLTGKDTKISFDGPELIAEDFGALIVTPEKGTNYTPFNFNIDFTTSKPRNVTLWARYDEDEWELIESKPVASKRETILFSNITPRKAFKKIAWKCKGIANESGITYTLWDIDLKWLNESIGRSPEKGWWNDTYNFSVTLSANAKGNVELKVKQDSTNEWKSVGNMPYTDQPNPQTLTWADEQICNDPYEGNTSYNFTFHWENVSYSNRSYQGPELYIPACIIIASCNVIPANGIGYIENNVLQGYFKNMNIPRFNYSINVSAAKDVRIKLVTTDCEGEVTEHEEKRYHAPGSKTLNWPVESSIFNRIGRWHYTFSYYDTRWSRWQDCRSEKCGEGPELIATLKEFTIDPTQPFRVYGESYNVSVVVNGSRDLDITLELCTTASCEPVGTGIYESSEEEREMIWTDIKPWVYFGSDKELKFNLNVTWGDGDV